ncbi:alpha/beta hydrolase [Amycolatopsis anabasis]|uniref:alpha/beta hydrolase n=1 Tax=Amycolatopsis anabasis TaxID=1840409 RepID=UPI001FEA2549|nr:alpha/beta hydrolase [Amycolatopsis anabasis]
MPTFRLSGRSAALAAASLFALAACSADPPPEQPPAPPPSTSATPDPAALQKYTTQKLTWGDCAPYAFSGATQEAFQVKGVDCARLTVPLDYLRPDGLTITLGLLRHKAAKPDQRIGSLVMDPGGPGGSGTQVAAQLVPAIEKTALGARFDFVGFDPRGVGASQPRVQCLTDQERDAQRAEYLEGDGSPEGVTKQEARAKDFAQKCLQRTEHGDAMLANLGTRDVARDLDVLRAVLGDEKLTYLGYSYGTRIGYTYAEMYPGKVRAMVLDGAVDPAQDEVEGKVRQAEAFGKSFGEFVKWCVQRPDCALGRDEAKATKTYQDLVRPLADKPVDAGKGRVLSYEDATTATVSAMYAKEAWEPLNYGLAELAAQRTGGVLLAMADEYNERGEDGKYTAAADAIVAINCVDARKITDKNRIADAQKRANEAAPFADDGKPDGVALGPCEFWPVPNTSQPHEPKADGLAPTLVISTTNDPATPYQAGVNLAKALKGGLLTVEGTQHTGFLRGNSCIDKAGIDYLVTLKLPADGARCSG